jgi:hypothetical protein
MPPEKQSLPHPTDSTVVVHLRPVDADAILAALEWALNHDDMQGQTLDEYIGSGLHRRNVEEAGRRIESVAALALRGVENRDIVGLIPPPHAGFTGTCPCGCGVEFKDGVQVQP